LDGWTSANTTSIYNFIILTPFNQQFLYCLRDFSSSHHTGDFLATEIKKIIDKIGAEKFSAIVTDNASNVRLAREIVTEEYPTILNLRCIAHFINLITKSILGKILHFLILSHMILRVMIEKKINLNFFFLI
jgi:hypothetical protein